ncbi:MAG: amidase [Candidatus Tectomicrobia bacterium]|uniref:Amidase n=1 Tax=Tectimicrobiota bacterium TaxID=2528274 RepID=A0A932I0I3_UNCTE|nr:amidase [Candidatus Tectomicrobia bacterium]
MTDLYRLPVRELTALYRAGKASPVEAARAALDRIRAWDGAVNAFCLVDEEGALASARASEERWRRGEPLGPLDGVPATIKDLVLARGWPTRRGSKTADEAPAGEDAPPTARLREGGAVLLGKTTTPELGWKGVTDSPLTGVTRNPWDTRMTPGGSSGGAAAACALGMGALHLGTDAGGSIRIPAGFTGVFGFKPSFGRVPTHPPNPNHTLAHAGPMTRTVEDAALMLNALARPDARDWFALPYEARDYREGLEDGVSGLRVAFSPSLGGAEVDAEVAERVASAAWAFEELGARVEEADPGLGDAERIFWTIYFAAAATLVGGIPREKHALMDPGLIEAARMGSGIRLEDYVRASVPERAALGRKMKLFHQGWDLLLTPMLPIPAFEAGREAPGEGEPGRWVKWTPFTYPFNLTGQPACSVPCGFTSKGLPAGLQIVGPMHRDALVLRAARAFERARPFKMPEGAREG